MAPPRAARRDRPRGSGAWQRQGLTPLAATRQRRSRSRGRQRRVSNATRPVASLVHVQRASARARAQPFDQQAHSGRSDSAMGRVRATLPYRRRGLQRRAHTRRLGVRGRARRPEITRRKLRANRRHGGVRRLRPLAAPIATRYPLQSYTGTDCLCDRTVGARWPEPLSGPPIGEDLPLSPSVRRWTGTLPPRRLATLGPLSVVRSLHPSHSFSPLSMIELKLIRRPGVSGSSFHTAWRAPDPW
jgi:hypothetical protein